MNNPLPKRRKLYRKVTRMKNTFIFDLDGTLINTLDSLAVSVNKTLEKLELPAITQSDCRNFIGNGTRELMRKSILQVGENCTEEFLDDVMKIFGEVFAVHCCHNVLPYDGIVSLLEKLKNQGYKIAVLSNKPHGEMVKIICEHFGEGFFDFQQGQSVDLPRKPDPMALEYVINQLGRTKAETLYIGDSEVDMQTGLSAGVDTVAVSWGFRDRDVLEKTRPTKIVDSVRELADYICL